MSDKETPLALRLANYFMEFGGMNDQMAAAELRRLYEENQNLKREWQAVTDEELKTLLAECNMDDRFSHRMVAAVVQKKLKEKNYD